MTLCLFVGGCKHDEWIDVDFDAMNRARYALSEDMCEIHLGDPSAPVLVDTYIPRRFGSQDGWSETVFILDSISPYDLSENEIIGFIMAGWQKRQGHKQNG